MDTDILNYLLRRCGQTDAILAGPNGFVAAIRYCLCAADCPVPGTFEYVVAMRRAIKAVRDGQRYYAGLCGLAPRDEEMPLECAHRGLH